MRPPEGAHLFEGKDLQVILEQLAEAILHAAMSPAALALHRLILAEAFRFPELAAIMSASTARKEAIERISRLLEHEMQQRRIHLQDTQFAAEQFLYLLIAAPQRRALGMDTPLTPPELISWAKNSVALFLHGCRYGN
jgi:hypothetical protein